MKNILAKDMTDEDGDWLKFPEDRILNYPMLEMAGQKHVHCYAGPPIYGYRDDNPQGDSLANAGPVEDALTVILDSPPYWPKTEEELRSHDCDWL